jgi:hypothetical protein
MKPRSILAIIIVPLLLSGCLSPTQIATVNADLAKAQTLVAALPAASSKATTDLNNALITTTGKVPSNVSNAESYESTAILDAQAGVTLLQGLASLITTSTTSTATAYAHEYWTAKGIAALHRYGINPRDPLALQKLARHPVAMVSIPAPFYAPFASPQARVVGHYRDAFGDAAIWAKPANLFTCPLARSHFGAPAVCSTL